MNPSYTYINDYNIKKLKIFFFRKKKIKSYISVIHNNNNPITYKANGYKGEDEVPILDEEKNGG